MIKGSIMTVIYPNIGGSIGAWLGMKVWHHKTMHKKFKYGVPTIIMLQIAAVVAVMMTSC